MVNSKEERICIAENVELWTVTQGIGRPIMFCNGGPGCCDYLEPIANMIDDIVTVHRWEQRGCGRSDHTPPYDHATCLADLDALRRQFGHEKWMIGGHSWGANLALDYALAYPQHVLAVVYLAGTGITEAWKPEYEQAERERTEFVPDFAYPFNRDVNKEGNRSRREYLLSPHLTERVRALEIPVLIIHGAQDLRPVWPVKQLAELLPQSSLHILFNAEHCLWIDHEQQLRDIIRAFLLSASLL